MKRIFFAGLFDFSFHSLLARRIVKAAYTFPILGGGIASCCSWSVSAFPAEGLINLGRRNRGFVCCRPRRSLPAVELALVNFLYISRMEIAALRTLES